MTDEVDDGDDDAPWPEHAHWRCKCYRDIQTLSQDECEENPYTCPICERTWDGRSWFRSVAFYNDVITWEDFATAVHDYVLGEEMKGDDGDAFERKGLAAMQVCNERTHCDPTVIWNVVAAVFSQGRRCKNPDQIDEALKRCNGFVHLLWHYAEAKPWSAEEWESESEEIKQRELQFQAVCASSEGRYVCQQRKLIDAGSRDAASVGSLLAEYRNAEPKKERRSIFLNLGQKNGYYR